MKWRNQLLALACLVLFAGLGVLYFKHWVIQKPFGIILFIGEGLAPERMAATRIYLGGADARLNLDSMPNLALATNASKDFAAADKAAAATAIATGIKTNNGAIALDGQGKTIPSIVDLARQHGRAVGLITDSRLTNTTCAAFYAHAKDGTDEENLATQLVEAGKIDIAMGGGSAAFLPEAKSGFRSDGRDLLLQLRGSGFDVIFSRAELEAVPVWRRPKLFGVFSKTELAFANQLEQWSEQPSLAEMVGRAIQLLQYNARGYLLLVDAGLMGKAAEQNDAEKTFTETMELDRAVALARRYAGMKSTVVVCGDVAVGGMSLNGFPFRKDSGLALLGLNASGEPWITWATGPNGNRSFGTSRTENGDTANQPSSEPAAFYSKFALVSVEDVLVFGSGPGTDAFAGSIENTQIFNVLRDEL